MVECANQCGRSASFFCRHEVLNYCSACSTTRHAKKPFMAHIVDTLCELCEAAPATHECVTCGPVQLCHSCDASEHSKPLRMAHVRSRLGAPTTEPEPRQTQQTPQPKSTFYLEGKVTSRRRVEHTQQQDTPTVADMKEKIRKIVHLAQKPGTEAESEHAKAIAQRLMRKYQLDLADVLKSSDNDDLVEATYEAKIVRISGAAEGREIKLPRWFGSLSRRVAGFFQDLVRSVHILDTTCYQFYGHEPSAWEATTLFVELFNTIGYYRQQYAERYRPGANALDNFAHGMVSGLSFVDHKVKDKDTIEDSEKLALVQSKGKAMLDAMTSRFKITTSRKRKAAFNKEAYLAGKKQAADINVASLGKQKIED